MEAITISTQVVAITSGHLKNKPWYCEYTTKEDNEGIVSKFIHIKAARQSDFVRLCGFKTVHRFKWHKAKVHIDDG